MSVIILSNYGHKRDTVLTGYTLCVKWHSRNDSDQKILDPIMEGEGNMLQAMLVVKSNTMKCIRIIILDFAEVFQKRRCVSVQRV